TQRPSGETCGSPIRSIAHMSWTENGWVSSAAAGARQARTATRRAARTVEGRGMAGASRVVTMDARLPPAAAGRSALPRRQAEEAAQHVSGDRRVLAQAAQRVQVPLDAVGHVDPQAMPVADEDAPELVVDAEQHLHLVAVAVQPQPVDELD